MGIIDMRRHILIFTLALAVVSCSGSDRFGDGYGVRPIYPDYVGVTIPSSIAPLNFVYTVEGAEDAVTTFTCGTTSVTIRGREVEWKRKEWQKLLSQAKGGGEIKVYSSPMDSAWTIYVSPDPIDYGIAYRLICPGYETAGFIGIYERDLSTFDEIPLMENTQLNDCFNCHSFRQTEPTDLSLHVRGNHAATILRRGGEMTAYNTKTPSTLGTCVYPYWHPSGDYIAYSTNTTRQCFHVRPGQLLEVYDIASDLQVYDIRNNCLISSPNVRTKENWETYPAFSPDGRTLYFCSCPEREIPAEMEKIKYNLYKVSFDAATGTFGEENELVIDAVSKGKSIAFPRPSYDGRYIMYSLFDYATFPIWHKESDLWLYDTATGETFPAEGANSDDAESYHSWSSNSRWFVFGSRRDDGRFTRAYICHIDENGVCGKAFMLPQEHPLRYYSAHDRSFNVPEFISGPVEFDTRRALKTITSDERENFRYRWSGSDKIFDATSGASNLEPSASSNDGVPAPN